MSQKWGEINSINTHILFDDFTKYAIEFYQKKTMNQMIYLHKKLKQ